MADYPLVAEDFGLGVSEAPDHADWALDAADFGQGQAMRPDRADHPWKLLWGSPSVSPQPGEGRRQAPTKRRRRLAGFVNRRSQTRLRRWIRA
jgi:hypothetical protein